MSLSRPKRLSSEEREDIILEAAGRLFSRQGYSGTTTRAIAQAAGVNEALLFRNFDNKEALYEAFLTRMLKAWGQEVIPALSDYQNQPLTTALTEIARVIIGRVASDPTLLRTMLFASLEDHRLGKAFFKKPLPLKEFMTAFFKERQKRGEIKKENPSLMAATYLSLIFYFIMVKEVFGATAEFFGQGTHTLNFFTKVFLEGILA